MYKVRMICGTVKKKKEGLIMNQIFPDEHCKLRV